MNHTTIAVDLAKNVFEIGVSHEPGKVSEQKRVNRAKLVSFFAKRPEATVLLEACGSSHSSLLGKTDPPALGRIDPMEYQDLEHSESGAVEQGERRRELLRGAPKCVQP